MSSTVVSIVFIYNTVLYWNRLFNAYIIFSIDLFKDPLKSRIPHCAVRCASCTKYVVYSPTILFKRHKLRIMQRSTVYCSMVLYCTTVVNFRVARSPERSWMGCNDEMKMELERIPK